MTLREYCLKTLIEQGFSKEEAKKILALKSDEIFPAFSSFVSELDKPFDKSDERAVLFGLRETAIEWQQTQTT